jgi:RNA polymerase sigma-70 factor, ECF subfamily
MIQPPTRSEVVRDLGEEALCARFLPRIRLFGQRHLREADVEDFCQDVLVAVLAAVRADRVEDPEKLGSFVLGVCRNLSAGRWRREAVGARAVEAATRDPAPPVEPDLTLFERWRVEDCLSRLTERARQVLRLSYCEDHTAEEVGDALDLQAGNVRVMRHRALAQLRQCVQTDPYRELR